ncbi:MAG: type II toxin-antitoxin system RelE/ParE family toxin [Thermoguttaceae bacterium]|jgi:plasmid stabilization system protein ParE|nr:type II toxin-antitoxin system RelE/ParE family toxin [Thermoguttaceae bacterium]
MISRVVFLPEAAQDVADARAWYEGQRKGLGETFVQAIDARINSLRANPEIHAIVRKAYRRAILSRFPYAIYYKHTGDTLEIWAVLHTSRNATVVRRRLG